jgi:hypothetical protein
MEKKIKKFFFVQVLPLNDGAPTPNRHHWSDKEQVRYDISLQDSSSHGLGYSSFKDEAHIGSEKRTACKMWQKATYNPSLPYVQNSISCYA